jgi:hypothetical protein
MVETMVSEFRTSFAAVARHRAHLGAAIVDGHYRVRQDRVCDSGTITLRDNSRLHHIGLGRRHAGQRVLVLAHDRHIRVLTEHGALIRELTLDPIRNYQPQPKT